MNGGSGGKGIGPMIGVGVGPGPTLGAGATATSLAKVPHRRAEPTTMETRFWRATRTIAALALESVTPRVTLPDVEDRTTATRMTGTSSERQVPR